MEEQVITEEQKQELEKQLLEVWDQTGLLQDAVSKVSLAKVLEASSRTILDTRPNASEQQVAYMVTMMLPIVTRALRTLEFRTENSENTETESVFVKLVETEEEQLQECINASAELYSKISKYASLVVSFVKISKFEGGFHLGLECASAA